MLNKRWLGWQTNTKHGPNPLYSSFAIFVSPTLIPGLPTAIHSVSATQAIAFSTP